MQKSYLRAIQTKYLRPTNSRPARVKAFDCVGNSITCAWDSFDDDSRSHRLAAETLRDQLGWKGELIGGHTKDGMVFLFRPEE
jgi:hypothetical protein